MILIVLDRGERRIADIEAWNVCRDRELGGHDTLEFLTTERGLEKGYRIILQMPDINWQEYVIDKIVEQRNSVHVICQHSIYELYGDFIEDRRPEGTCDEALDVILEYTRWARKKPSGVGKVIKNSMYRITARESLAKLLNDYDVELNYSVDVGNEGVTNRWIWLEERIGNDLGKRFEAGYDADGVTRTIETDHIITALYAFGRGQTITDDEGSPTGGFGRRVNISSINDGKMYVENNEARLKYGRLTPPGTRAHVFGRIEYDDTEDPQVIRDRAIAELAVKSQPRVTYSGRVVDLAQIEGFEHEGVDIGDQVLMIDDEQDIQVQARVLRYRNYLDNSKLSEIEIGNFKDPRKQILALQRSQISSLREQLATDPTNGMLEQLATAQVRDLLKRWREKMNDGLETGSITTFPGGFIFESETGATLIGPQGMMVADTKKPNGEWDFKSFITGSGLGSETVGAEQLIAASINSDHISVGGIDAEKIKLESGDDAQTVITQLQAGQLTISDQLAVGGENLLRNPTFGTPHLAEKTGWSTGEIMQLCLARFKEKTMAEMLTTLEGKTINDLINYNY